MGIILAMHSYLWKHTREDLEPQIFLVPQAVCPPLNHPDLVVESFHEPKRHLVLRSAIGHDTVPVLLDHLRKLLVGRQALPLQRCLPVVEKLAGPAFPIVAPKLPEGFLEKVGLGKALIGCQKLLERPLSIQTEIGLPGQQRVFLPLNVGPFLARQATVFALADLVQRVSQVFHHMELIEQNGRVRAVLQSGVSEWLPHIHDRQPNFPGLLLSPLLEEQVHAFLRAIYATNPDGPFPQQITDHDTIGVPFADRDLVHAYGLWGGAACSSELLLHVLLVQLLCLVPIQEKLFGDALDACGTAAAPNVIGKTLRIERVVREEGKPFLLHLAAAPALDAANLQVQENAESSAGKVSHTSPLPVVEASVAQAASTADCFFSRRVRVTTRAWASPKIPCTVGSGRKPGKRYASSSFLEWIIRKTYQNSKPSKDAEAPVNTGLKGYHTPFFTHSIARRPDLMDIQKSPTAKRFYKAASLLGTFG